ncbi:MAG: hypothetical protein Q7J25_14430, partial [Vicinamibacterales bacterium]|nr:hypothetical protein [Vicinamibacterales bacterium]
GTLGRGVFRTTDGGSTWTAVNAGLTDLNVESLAVDPVHPELVYAGTVGKGLFKSRDAGVTWSPSATGMTPTERVNAIVVHPIRPGVVFAGSHESGVYLSLDGGVSWATLNTGLRSRSIRALAIAADGSVVYAATFGEGVFRLGTLPGTATVPPHETAAPASGVIRR